MDTTLERDLHSARARIGHWAQQKQKEAVDVRTRHDHAMKEHAGTITSFQSTKDGLLQAVEGLHQRLGQEKRQLMALQSAQTAVTSERDTIGRQLAVYQEAVHAQQVECLKRESDVMVAERYKTQRTATLKQEVTMYASRLGLEFKQVPGGELKLIMTQINRRDPAQRFQVSVRITEDNKYTVTQCDPTVPSLPDLVARLNKTNQFSDFLIALRSQFVALVE